jgi:hypothetical protein
MGSLNGHTIDYCDLPLDRITVTTLVRVAYANELEREARPFDSINSSMQFF